MTAATHISGGEVPLALKDWFRGGSRKDGPQEYTVDDLIVLERYDEAADRLQAKLKASPNDLHSHLKLAEVYTQLQRFDKAVIEYGFVADEYARDGFFDKGIAVLSRAVKLAPMDVSLRHKIDRFQHDKSMEHVRGMALEGLRQAGGQTGGTTAMELQRLWHKLVRSTLVQGLPGEQLKRLFAAMRLVRYPAEASLATEGSRDSFLVLLVEGVVECWIAGEGGSKPVSVRTFSSGDLLGESALLERTPWPASYRAADAVTALTLSREGLELTLLGNSDPRGLLSALRAQRNDQEVLATVRRLRGTA
ncbi:MAG TPA: cyclic nucleotide-binding domain-containing protein [Thermoanaerobaculia bacterium]|nr:cyclic nucleotide-binding domain-containing protein [Thermoanaerobaculia bacterium]